MGFDPFSTLLHDALDALVIFVGWLVRLGVKRHLDKQAAFEEQQKKQGEEIEKLWRILERRTGIERRKFVRADRLERRREEEVETD